MKYCNIAKLLEANEALSLRVYYSPLCEEWFAFIEETGKEDSLAETESEFSLSEALRKLDRIVYFMMRYKVT